MLGRISTISAVLYRIWQERKRLHFVGLGVVGSFALLLVACGGEDTPTPTSVPVQATPTAQQPDSEREFEELIAAAQEEGEFVISGGGTARRLYGPVFEEFGEKYDINVTIGGGSGPKEAERVIAEARAGVYAVDLMFGGVANAQTVANEGLLAHIPDLFVLPEVADQSLYYEGQHWYGYLAGGVVGAPFLFSTRVEGADIAYNSDLVNPEEITSYFDLLDPKFRSLMVITEVDHPSVLGGMARYYLQPELGPKWMDPFVLETDVTMVTDRDLIIDWLITGVKGLSMFHGTRMAESIKEAAAAGAPVGYIGRPLEEGAALRSVGSGMVMFAPGRAANPNAAKLMLNLWLSREGQIAMQIANPQFQSTRNDIPTDVVVPDSVRQPGIRYMYVEGDPQFGERRLETEDFARDLMTRWRAAR